jgi:hypothetical protein
MPKRTSLFDKVVGDSKGKPGNKKKS